MIDSTDNSQAISTDLEFSGALNKAISHDQNSNFGLLLAMLQQDVLDRRLLAKESEEAPYGDSLNQINHYRSPNLLTEEHHWSQQRILNQNINNHDIPNAHLWACLFPPPLSLYNDRYRIDDEIKNNTSYDTQQKLDAVSHEPIEPDATKLYDILNSLSEI